MNERVKITGTSGSQVARACGSVTLNACRDWVSGARARKTQDRHKLTASFLLPKINFAIVFCVANSTVPKVKHFLHRSSRYFWGAIEDRPYALFSCARCFVLFFSSRNLFYCYRNIPTVSIRCELRHDGMTSPSQCRAQRFLPLFSVLFFCNGILDYCIRFIMWTLMSQDMLVFIGPAPFV